MKAETARDFNKRVARMDAEERRARLRWIEYTVHKRVEAADGPIELEYVSLASLHALLTCNRDLIPVEFWRPAQLYR